MVPFSQLGPECPLQPLPSNGNNPSAPYILQGTTGNGRTTTVSQDEVDSSEDDSTTWYERLRDARKHDEATKLEDISGAPDHARNTLDASSYRDEHEKNLRGTSQQDQTSSSAASVEAGQVEEVLEVGCTNSLPGEPQTSSCALDEIWVQLETEAGQTYYWNRLDDSTSLELPAGVHAKWIQQRLQDGRSYYWTRDGESTWHLRSLANTHDKASMNSGVLASGIPRDVDGEVTAARQSSCCSAEAGAVVAEKLQEDAKELSEICHVETHNIEVEDIISKHLRARSAWEQRVPCQDVVDVPILEVTETMPLDDPAMPHHEPRIGEVGVTNSVAAEDQSFDTAVAELTELLTSVDALTSSSKAAAEKKAAEENAVAEAARKAAEEKAAAEKEAATERAAEEKAAAEKKAAEEKAMVEAAKKAAAEKKAAEDKAAAEKKAAADKAAAEAAKKAAERAAAEKKAAEDKAAAEKKAAEEKAAAEAAKKAAEKVAAEKKAAEEKASAEKKAAEKRAAEKAAAEASAEKEEALKLRIELAMLRGELEAQTKLLEAKAKRGYKEVLVSERLHIGQEPALTVKEDEKETLALPDQSKDVSRGQIDSSNSFKSHSRDAVECKADPTKQVEIGKSHKKRKGGDPNLQLAKNHTVNTLAPSGGIAPHETKDEGGRRSEPVAAAKEVRSDASHCSSRSSDTHPIQQGCSGKSHAAGDVKLNVLDANDELRRDLEDFEKELPALKRRRGSNPQPAQTIVPTGPELHQEKLDPWQQLSDAVLKKKKPRQERSHVEELPKRKKSEEADEKSGKESTPLKKELPKRKKPEEADEKSEKDERVTKLKEVDDQVRHSKVKRVKQGGIAVNVLRELSSARRVQSVSITTDAREDVGTIDKENCRMSNESLEQEHVMVRSRAESCKLKRGSSPQTLSSKTLMSDNSLPHGRSDEQSQPRATRDTNSSRRETKAILKAREASPRTSCAARGKEADDCLLGKFLASVRFGVPPGNWGNDTAVKAVAPNSLPDSCPWANRLGA